MPALSHAISSGLSPRVRGNLAATVACTLAMRSIPASAGEPSLGGLGHQTVPVYPRECGGTRWLLPVLPSRPGLSPRVRGEPKIGECLPCRITVYPRECGGTGLSWAAQSTSSGLSPRVRGNRGQHRRVGERTRSIPASAGEPKEEICEGLVMKVYPRECGGTG